MLFLVRFALKTIAFDLVTKVKFCPYSQKVAFVVKSKHNDQHLVRYGDLKLTFDFEVCVKVINRSMFNLFVLTIYAI